jgi:hypothetical protein
MFWMEQYAAIDESLQELTANDDLGIPRRFMNMYINGLSTESTPIPAKLPAIRASGHGPASLSALSQHGATDGGTLTSDKASLSAPIRHGSADQGALF